MVHYTDSFPGREIHINGIPHLYFGGTSYLGLQDYPEFQELFIENIKKYGTNYGASRKANVRFIIYDEAEEHLAKLAGSESCISLSSGYLAGQFLSGFLESKHKLFYAPNTHSAVLRSNTKNYSTFDSLLDALEHYLREEKEIIPVIFLDSISFSGENHPQYENLKRLPLSKIILAVDDSHGIGINGKNGRGAYETLKEMYPKKLFVCCSLGKGFGIQAGAVLGSKSDLDEMRSSTFYGGASPASPSAMATFIKAEAIYGKRRTVLRKNLDNFVQHVNRLEEFQYMKGHPTFSFQNPELVSYLRKNQIVVTDFNYPDEKAKKMSRIVISANHIKSDIHKITTTLNSFYA